MPNYFTELQNGPSGPFYKAKDEAATSAIEAIVNEYGAKNLLPCSVTTQTIEGVTFTVNSDGSVTASGTASANGAYIVYHRFINSADFNGKAVVLSGCPSGGGASSYSIEGFRVAGSSSYQDNRGDYGEGVEFTWNNDSSQVVPEIQVSIAPNYAIQGTITFYPMIRDARITDLTYVPYAMTNKELTERVSVTSGTTNHPNVTWKRFGNIVVVSVVGATTGGALTGLPTPVSYALSFVCVSGTSNIGGYIQVVPSGTNNIHVASGTVYGSLTYICEG